MSVQQKSLALSLDPESEGSFRARFATLNVVDKDGDVTLPGAFPIGKRVLISAYMHQSWNAAVPVGEGVINADENEAWVDGKFWLDTAAGMETYKVVKNAGDLQEWSYGYEILAMDPAQIGMWPGAKRVFSQLDVIEVSPVLVGAGVNTATLAIKSAKKTFTGPALAMAREAVAKLKAGTLDSAVIAAIAQIDAMTDELDDAVDALMVQLGIPDPDEMGATPEPGDLPAGVPSAEIPSGVEPDITELAAKGFSFSEHSDDALAGVRSFIERSRSLADLRAKKQRKAGRVLSTSNRARLAALAEGLTAGLADIQALLAETEPAIEGKADEEMQAIWLDFQRRQAVLIA